MLKLESNQNTLSFLYQLSWVNKVGLPPILSFNWAHTFKFTGFILSHIITFRIFKTLLSREEYSNPKQNSTYMHLYLVKKNRINCHITFFFYYTFKYEYNY